MKTLTRMLPRFEVKAIDDAARTFEGISAAYSLDLGRDVIHPGAFKRTLDHWKQSGRVLPLLDQHPTMLNPSHSVTEHTLGKLVDAEEREAGLWTRFKVASTRAGDDLLALLKDGMVEGLSIGYAAINPQNEGGVRHLREVRVDEISVVTFGMNEDALIDLTSVKSLSAALREGRLTPEQKAELRALLSEPDPPDEGTPAGKGPALYEGTDALRMRLRLLKLHRPAA